MDHSFSLLRRSSQWYEATSMTSKITVLFATAYPITWINAFLAEVAVQLLVYVILRTKSEHELVPVSSIDGCLVTKRNSRLL